MYRSHRGGRFTTGFQSPFAPISNDGTGARGGVWVVHAAWEDSPPPASHAHLAARALPPPSQNVEAVEVVKEKKQRLEMADTSYGRFLATQKRDAERAYQHMDAEEREAFLWKLTEIDTDDAEYGQSLPSNPTPV